VGNSRSLTGRFALFASAKTANWTFSAPFFIPRRRGQKKKRETFQPYFFPLSLPPSEERNLSGQLGDLTSGENIAGENKLHPFPHFLLASFSQTLFEIQSVSPPPPPPQPTPLSLRESQILLSAPLCWRQHLSKNSPPLPSPWPFLRGWRVEDEAGKIRITPNFNPILSLSTPTSNLADY